MKLLHLFLTLFTTTIFLSCSSDKETLQVETNITAYSEDVVELQSSGAKAYSWRQLSGTDVILVYANSATPNFIVPSVTKQESLVFELEALISQMLNKDITLTKQVQVNVLPKNLKIDTNTTSKKQKETNTTQPTVSLKSLKLTIEKTSLNIETNTTLKVVATYQDNTIKDVTNEVEWIYADKLAISIQKHTLKTNHKDTNIFLQAKYNNKLSNRVALEIYIEINGHRLPPEPNPTINNATLLGVDSNNNGVRDDVERWIYEEYKEKHPIHIDIAMQEAKANKKILEIPEKALEIHNEVNRAVDCQAYYKYTAKYFNEPILIQENVLNEYFRSEIYFNTQERKDAYLLYDSLLSGGAYDLPPFNKERKAACDFNTSKYEE